MKIGKDEAARIAAEYGVECPAGTQVKRVPFGARAQGDDLDSWKEIQARRGRIRARHKKFEKSQDDAGRAGGDR